MFLKWKLIQILQCMVKVMVFNGTFNNNSVILWWSVSYIVVVSYIGGGNRRKHRPIASH